MSDQASSPQADDATGRGRSIRAPALVAVALAVVVAVIVLVVRTTGGPPNPSTMPTPGGTGSGATTTAPSGSTTGTPAASTTATRSAPPSGSATRSSSPAGSRTPSNDPRPPSTRSPVPIRTPVEVQSGLVASIIDLEAVEGEAQGPGEVGGPAVRFTLRLRNDSDQELPLATTVVNLYYGRAETPASPLDEPGGAPLPTVVAAGAEATATYIFVVPRSARDRVLITVDYSIDVSLVAFRGAAPR